MSLELKLLWQWLWCPWKDLMKGSFMRDDSYEHYQIQVEKFWSNIAKIKENRELCVCGGAKHFQTYFIIFMNFV